jgi:hypothetical protein
MDGLSAAASVIAVVDLSLKVISLCSQYFNAVKKAKEDILHLQSTAENLIRILENCHDLLEGPYKSKLETSQQLKSVLNECKSDLEKLISKLEVGTGRKAIRRLGFRLRWPFASNDVDKIVQDLQQRQANVSAAMQIDQTYATVNRPNNWS